MTNTYDMLYNVHPDGFAELNAAAHPGGGTETIEVGSGEGLVEDQFEAHLKGMHVAYKEPTANILANLANILEDNRFVKVASLVDALLMKVAEDFELNANPQNYTVSDESPEYAQIRLGLQTSIKNLKSLLSSVHQRWFHQTLSDWGILPTEIPGITSAKRIIDKLISSTQEKDLNFDTIIELANSLDPDVNKSLWDGSGGLTSLDWESDNIDRRSEFMQWKDHIVKIALDAKLRVGSEGVRNRKGPELEPTTNDAYVKLTASIQKIEAFARSMKSLGDSLSTDLTPNQEKQFENLLVQDYNKNKATFDTFFKLKSNIALIKDLSSEDIAYQADTVNAYWAQLNTVAEVLVQMKENLKNFKMQVTNQGQ